MRKDTYLRTTSQSLKSLVLVLGLTAVGLGGACHSSSESSDSGAAGSIGHDGAAGAGGTGGIDSGSVVDSSMADTRTADTALDVSLATEAGKPVDAGLPVEVGTSEAGHAIDVSASEAGRSVDVGATNEAGGAVDAKDSASTASTGNLIVNGDAEAAVGSTDGQPVATPGWTITGNATAITWGASGGYPITTDPGPSDRGKNFLAGGPSDELSTLSQTISLASYGNAFAGGSVTFALSAYLGGFSSQEDNAVLALSFRNAGGAEISTTSIGPVTAAERVDATGLLLRKTTGAVPPAARSVVVTLTMTRLEGSANDGYADNLSLVLTGI
jgi:hypothetical protein